jgi:hypothetical protein
MNVKKTYILISIAFTCFLFGTKSYCQSSVAEELSNCYAVSEEYIHNSLADTTVAINDTFELLVNCHGNLLCGNVLTNDSFMENKSFEVCFVCANISDNLTLGTDCLTFGNDGHFTFEVDKIFNGTFRFSYKICELGTKITICEAQVIIYVQNDFDCDLIVDLEDLDIDNDGILNIDEGDGLLDTDLDSIPDSFDIDSDNDGIPDNIEWQTEGGFIPQSELDTNQNGWDDAYDVTLNGIYYEPVDTDKNGIPDYLDIDSDNDEISDNIEGFDENEDGLPDIVKMNLDTDKDGLDDGYDITESWSLGCNSAGSNCLLPDSNKNGIRDWREAKEAIPGEENPSKEFSPDALIFPNPSDGNFTVNIPSTETNIIAQLSVYNSVGKLIYQKSIQTGLNEIKLQKLLAGIYLVKISSSTFNSKKKISIL